MADPIITLTTDFGEASPYVAAMKGVILGINPAARIVDLTHQIPPQNVGHAAFFLAAATRYFPQETLHVVVVDPGVGTERALLYVEVNGQRLLVPDNGCWTELSGSAGQPSLVIRLTEPRYWHHPVSATFHGRDILAPVAAHLSLGVDPHMLGVNVEQWIRFQRRPPSLEPDRLLGEVEFVDGFGNLISNLPSEALSTLAPPLQFRVGEHDVHHLVRSYAEAEPGTPIALISSGGMLEIAITNGSAAHRLDARVGTQVLVTPARDNPSMSAAAESPAADFALDVLPPALPRRAPDRGMRSGIFIALVFVPLISYSVLATIAVAVLFLQVQSHDPLEFLPDREGDLKGANRRQQGAVMYDRVPPERELPGRLKVALGRTIQLGDLEVTPERVELRRVEFRRPGFAPEPAVDDSLVLYLRMQNISQDIVFSPTDPFFDRCWKGLASGKKPYTFLDIGKNRLWGGPLPWKPGRHLEEEDRIRGQQYKNLQPGEQLTTFVCTDPQDHVGKILRHYQGNLVWRVQVRRGLVPVRDREYPATSVIGVQFKDTDIVKPAM
jgi:S-adenosylmethionine hydrolase